jgi:hypothetical protein
MTDNLTYDILVETATALQKLMPYKMEADVVLLTNHERRLLQEMYDFDTVRDNYYHANRIMGIPLETFETKSEVLKRGAELIGEGKMVIVIKNDSMLFQSS